MENVNELRNKILARQYEFSKHALDQSIKRGISIAEVEEAASNGIELIENYPEDKYSPSCLVLGFTNSERPLHIQCSDPGKPLISIVTLYEPDSGRWINHRIRKTR